MTDRYLVPLNPDDDRYVQRIRFRYECNPSEHNVVIDEPVVTGGHWRIVGRVVVDSQPINHAILVDQEHFIEDAKDELTQHLRMFANAYVNGERWESEKLH